MSRVGFPRIEPFTISRLPWQFVDIRTLAAGDQQIAVGRFLAQVQRLEDSANRPQSIIKLCNADRDQSEICPRPGLPQILLVAKSRDGIVGGLGLTNLETESESTSVLQVNSELSPGLPVTRSWGQMKVLGVAMRWILENNLKLDDGRDVDVIEWVLHRAEKYRYSTKINPETADLFAELSPIADRENNPDDSESPIRYRRKNSER